MTWRARRSPRGCSQPCSGPAVSESSAHRRSSPGALCSARDGTEVCRAAQEQTFSAVQPPRHLPPSFSCFYRSPVSRLFPEASRKSHIVFSRSRQCLPYTHKLTKLQQEQAEPRSHSGVPPRHLRQRTTHGRHTGPGQLQGLAAQQRCCQMLGAAQTCSLGPASRQDLWRSCLYKEIPAATGYK